MLQSEIFVLCQQRTQWFDTGHQARLSYAMPLRLQGPPSDEKQPIVPLSR